jgi:hypothetical protein
MSVDGLSEALWARLGLITDGPAGGWWPLRLPEDVTLPAGTYQRISSAPTHTHDGATALRARRYQLTIYSETYAAGLACARAVVAAIDGTRDDWSGWAVSAMLADEAEDIDPEPRGMFRQRVDVMLRTEAP